MIDNDIFDFDDYYQSNIRPLPNESFEDQAYLAPVEKNGTQDHKFNSLLKGGSITSGSVLPVRKVTPLTYNPRRQTLGFRRGIKNRMLLRSPKPKRYYSSFSNGKIDLNA